MKQLSSAAIEWFNRALKVENLNSDESMAMKYELANAYEMSGDTERAVEYFEQIYAEDIEYRDVANRLEDLWCNLVSA